ncbi:hypothetical protein ACROYT_G023832 [Oculina patagonica]
MKWIILLLLVVGTAAFVAESNIPIETRDSQNDDDNVPDPIAFYPLNSKYDTREIENRQPQGTPVGVSLAAGPNGKAGGSYQFTGQANSYIEFPNNGGLDVQRSITMLCWIYPENTAGPLFNYKASGSWGIHMWMVSPGKLFARFTKRDYQFTSALISNHVVALNQWHYVGASYDHNTGIASLWLDGEQVLQQNIGAGLTLATQDKVRMGVKTGDSRYFKGQIAAMQIYNVALTEEQIHAVRFAFQDVNLPDPIAFYPLNSKYDTREIENRQPQGTPVGVSLAAGPNGKAGGSYQFTGQASSYIEFLNNGGLDVQHSITMLCWIYPENTAGPLFNYKTSGSWGIHMWIVSPGKLFARFTKRDYQFTPALITSQSLALNQWHYVGTSYDRNTGVASLWLNGQQVVQQNIGAGLTLATQDKVRMGVKGGDGRYFKGRIAAMQIYDFALTAEQINAVESVVQGGDEESTSPGFSSLN